jgi:hypothetical protein
MSIAVRLYTRLMRAIEKYMTFILSWPQPSSRWIESAARAARHTRIFDWEAVRPTAVYRKLVTEEATPFLSFSIDLVRRFMPEGDPIFVARHRIVGA